MQDFIAIYDHALEANVCQHIINHFEASPKKRTGVTGQGVDLQKKQSEDLSISGEVEWSDINQFLTQVTLQYLVNYMRHYSYLLVGPLSPSVWNPVTQKMVTLTPEDINSLPDTAIAKIITRLYHLGTINVQKYQQGKGGYYHFHSEIYPSANDPKNKTLRRVLLFMYYLNDVTKGGKTEFYYQQCFIRPQAGRLVIAPAGFTHTHKGHVPQSNDKYILTSWVLFQPAAYLYGKGN